MFREFFKQLHTRIRLLCIKDKGPYLSLYKLLGFLPVNLQLYELAFLHKSSSVKTSKGIINNERLEFLGDAILSAVVADIVYRRYPNRREGFMTNARSKIVQRDTLNKVAVQLGLDRLIVFSTRLHTHNNYLYGNALEALIGAIYLDQGYQVCFRFIEEVIINRCIDIDKMVRKKVNFKSSLIEWGQKNKLEISFDLIESFMDHEKNPVFQTAVSVLGEQIGIGTGYSKKESQQAASQMAINRLRTDKSLQLRISEAKKNNEKEQTEPHEFTEFVEDECSAEEGDTSK